MIRKKNGKGRDLDVECILPFSYRPNLVIVRLKDGRTRTFGDGNGLSQSEFLAINTLAETTTPRLELTQQERLELSDAADQLQRCTTLVDQLLGQKDLVDIDVKAANDAIKSFDGMNVKRVDDTRVRQLEAELQDLEGRLIEARDLEVIALRDYNAINVRIHRSARQRQFPVQYHKPKLSNEQRLNDLEERQ